MATFMAMLLLGEDVKLNNLIMNNVMFSSSPYEGDKIFSYAEVCHRAAGLKV